MGQSQNRAFESKGKHVTWEERLIIHRLLYKNKIKSPKLIAEILGKHKRTIQREIRRGWNELTDTLLLKVWKYSPDFAQLKADKNKSAKGPQYKLGKDWVLVNAISNLILNERYSPDAVVMHFNEYGWPSDTVICTKTLYRYIYEGLIPGVDESSLVKKGKYRNTIKKSAKRHNRAVTAKKSIEYRPVEADERTEFGHWEIDCVVGGKNTSNESLLVLTERKYRNQIIRKIKSRSQIEVISALDRIERKIGTQNFREIFKTITADNGSEFLDSEGIEKSARSKKKRTAIYYAHPYCAAERGSNENANGIIRRFIPKGDDIANHSKEYIESIQDWMNRYPRRILNGKAAIQCLQGINAALLL